MMPQENQPKRKVNPYLIALLVLIALGLLLGLYLKYGSPGEIITPENEVRKYMEKNVLTPAEKDRIFHIMTKESESVELNQEDRARLIDLLNN